MPKALKPSPSALLGVVAKQGEAPLTPPYALGENTKRGDWDDLGEHHARQNAKQGDWACVERLGLVNKVQAASQWN
jgi:hypothetical protein